jgi:hypothetical protein
MRHLKVERQQHAIPPSTEMRTFADEPAAEPIRGPVIARDDNGSLVFAQFPITNGKANRVLEWLPRAFEQVGFPIMKRMAGFAPQSQTFGSAPPEPMRRRYACTTCGFDRIYPRVSKALQVLLEGVVPDVRQQLPEEVKEHEEKVYGNIHDDWLLAGQAWSSGVINRSTMLPYHTDRTNVSAGLSLQVNLRKNAEGGCLHFPEYGVWILPEDGTVTVFRGGTTFHAVTPIHLQKPDAYRYSIVYYAKSTLHKCGARVDEAKRAAKYQTWILEQRLEAKGIKPE